MSLLTKPRIRLIISAVFVLTLISGICAGVETPKKKICKGNTRLSGSCFKIRGRTSFSNGNPSIRIWPVGTNRMLGVAGGENNENVPDELVEKLSWDNAIFADFRVCPFTDDKPGEMRMVCVEAAENIAIRKTK